MHPLYERYHRFWETLYWLLVAALHIAVNTASALADIERHALPFHAWEPFTWEFTSQFVILLLIPVILRFDRYCSLNHPRLARNLLGHLLFSVVFSVLHVLSMVAMRMAIYQWHASEYDFGDWQKEWWYEYRKDVLTYAGIVSTIYVYRFILARLRGEASAITEGEDAPQPILAERFLVKKFGKEFIVRVSDIDWVEASGNYMNLHVGTRIYPLRATMAEMEKTLNDAQFLRIHRSSMVNIDRILEIQPQESGDAMIQLSSGQALPFSRTYRAKLKDKIHDGMLSRLL